MKTVKQILTAAVLGMTVAARGWAGEVKVISHSSLPVQSISAAELRGIFLLQRRAVGNGYSVRPVLQKTGATHEAFVREFLKRDSEEIRIYYQGLLFTGKGTLPEELDSDAEVIAYVAKTKGAIGYVSSSAETKGVKVLAIASKAAQVERALLIRVEPVYPKELHQRGIEGTVRLSLTVSARGSVESVRVIGGNPILAEEAVKAAKQWIYSPAAASNTVVVSIAFDAQR